MTLRREVKLWLRDLCSTVGLMGIPSLLGGATVAAVLVLGGYVHRGAPAEVSAAAPVVDARAARLESELRAARLESELRAARLDVEHWKALAEHLSHGRGRVR